MLWAFWLGLAVLAFVQIRIATADEIAIPDGVLRGIETRLAERGLRFTFGAIQCDAKGNILVRDLSLYSGTHDDPIVTARAVRFEVNPYALWLHRITPRKATINGASFRIPAMFSSEGTNLALIDDINAEIEFKTPVLNINGLTARAGNLAIMCRGAVVLPPKTSAGATKSPSEVLSAVILSYLQVARRIDAIVPQLTALDDPVLDITLTADTVRLAQAKIELTANSLHVEAGEPQKPRAPSAIGATDSKLVPPSSPFLLVLGPLSASTAVELSAFSAESLALGTPVRINFSTTEALMPANVRADNARLALTVPLAQVLQIGRKSIATTKDFPLLDVSLAGTVDDFSTAKITARAITARATGRFPSEIQASITANLLGENLAIETTTDFAAQNTSAKISTRVGAEHIDLVSREVNYDVGAILKPARPIGLDAVVRFDAGWKLATARGDLDIGPIHAYRVDVDRARGTFNYDHGTRTIVFSPAFAAIGESFANGSYEMNFDTLDFRFLLAGDLRPPAIRGWLGAWWPAFWAHFDFAGAAPRGDVDVQGNWKKTNLVNVFVFGEGRNLSYKKVALDHVQLTLFTRPDFYDGLDLLAIRGGGHVRGVFTHQNRDPDDQHIFTTLDFTGRNIDPVGLAPAISPALVRTLDSLQFSTPPDLVKIVARIDGPASPHGQHTSVDIEAKGAGAFSYDHLPLTTISAQIAIRDDVLDIKQLDTQLAGGHLGLKAQLSGEGAARRLGFDATLNRASLGRTIQVFENLATRARGEMPGAQSKIQQQLASGQLDLRLSADGLYNDSLSYKGNGSAEVSGAELVNVNIFGALSNALRGVKMLNFTSLNLTGGQLNFTIDQKNIIIPEAVLTGQKAMVKLSGNYALDTKQANLTARVYPLSQSRNIFGQGLGFLLVPITHLTELKLSGPLDAPKWRFSYGPTSFFRAFSGGSSGKPAEESALPPISPLAPIAPEPEPKNGLPETLRRPQ